MRSNVLAADKDQLGFEAILKAAYVCAMIENYAGEVVSLLDSDKDLPLYIFDQSNDKVCRIRYCMGAVSKLASMLNQSSIINH